MGQSVLFSWIVKFEADNLLSKCMKSEYIGDCSNWYLAYKNDSAKITAIRIMVIGNALFLISTKFIINHLQTILTVFYSSLKLRSRRRQ